MQLDSSKKYFQTEAFNETISIFSSDQTSSYRIKENVQTSDNVKKLYFSEYDNISINIITSQHQRHKTNNLPIKR